MKSRLNELLLENYQVLNFPKSQSTEDFQKKLLAEDIITTLPGNEYPCLKNVLATVKKASGKRGIVVVVERDYVDVDFRDSYQRHYSKAFRQIRSHCKRLHFFSNAPNSDFPPEFLFDLEKHNEFGYLGCVTIRPTGTQMVGKSFIAPPLEANHEYLLSVADYDVHLNGHPLRIHTAPFIQQDAHTYICAGAALWVASMHMHRKYRYPRFYPSQITDLARKYNLNGQVRLGMNDAEIVTAIKEMGLNPIIASYEMPESKVKRARLLADIKSVLYSYVESELVPILGYATEKGGHAVAVIGHNFNPRKVVSRKSFRKPRFNSDWIDYFIAQDDALGPFSKYAFESTGPDVTCLNELLGKKDQVCVIIGLPQEITLAYDNSSLLTLSESIPALIKAWNNGIRGYASQEPFASDPNEHSYLLQHIIDSDHEKQLVYRSSLNHSSNFKNRIITSRMPDKLKKIYSSAHMPEWVWVIELSDCEHLNQSDQRNRMACGEVIIDATAYPHDGNRPIMLFHYKDIVLDLWKNEPYFLDGPGWYTHDFKGNAHS